MVQKNSSYNGRNLQQLKNSTTKLKDYLVSSLLSAKLSKAI